MFKGLGKISVLAVMSLAFAGCNMVGSATDVVGSAYYNLMKGDYASFKSDLSGDALAQYGNDTAAAGLKAKLNGLNLHVGNATMLTSTQTDVNHWLETYTVDVIEKETNGQQFVLFTATAVCDASTPGPCFSPQTQGCIPEQQYQVTRFCSVDSIPPFVTE